jgi:hypothetical protein
VPLDGPRLVDHEALVANAEILRLDGARVRVLVEAVGSNRDFTCQRLEIHLAEGRAIAHDKASLSGVALMEGYGWLSFWCRRLNSPRSAEWPERWPESSS